MPGGYDPKIRIFSENIPGEQSGPGHPSCKKCGGKYNMTAGEKTFPASVRQEFSD